MRGRQAIVLAAVLVAGVAGSAGAAAPFVHVTGRTMDVNGQTEVPKGLFGVHAVKLSPEMIADWGIECLRALHHGPGSNVTMPKAGSRLEGLSVIIDCQGDRYHPATCLTDPDYAETCARWGREYAMKCGEAGYRGTVEFWNEPYLNWACKPGVNYDPTFYEVGEAAVGKPMRIKGWAKPLEFLVWSRQVRTVHAAGGRTDINAYLAYAYLGKDRPAGAEFEFRGRRYRNQEMWWGKDPTQKHYYSGQQNVRFYTWMLVPFAKAVKTANPDVQVVAGWDFNIFGHGWDSWETLYRPTIDAAAEWIDGISEHHYGSNTRRTVASYEVVTAYGMTRHGRWLRCYNTETAGCVDPEKPGGRHGTATPFGAFNYGLRDIVECLYRCPGKAASRTAHGSTTPGWGGGGDEFLFKLLKDLRGPLVHAATDTGDLWPVASLSDGRLVVVIYNDAAEARAVRLRLDAPENTVLGPGVATHVFAGEPKGPLTVETRPFPAKGRQWTAAVEVPARNGLKLVVPLEGTPPDRPQLARRQAFADCVLQDVAPETPVKTTVTLDPARLKAAEAAYLQLVLEGVGDGEATVAVGGRPVRLPDADQVVRVPIDARMLAPETTLTFVTKGDGYRVGMASVVLDGPAR